MHVSGFLSGKEFFLGPDSSCAEGNVKIIWFYVLCDQFAGGKEEVRDGSDFSGSRDCGVRISRDFPSF